MPREVTLNQLRSVLESLEYPISRGDAREDVSDVTLSYADGRESLAAVVDRANQETFEGVDDLETEIYNNLPVEAVGEPGQSEGEG
jgi:hypothetical protein